MNINVILRLSEIRKEWKGKRKIKIYCRFVEIVDWPLFRYNLTSV